MTHLRGMASGSPPDQRTQEARLAWQQSMARRLRGLRSDLAAVSPEVLASRSGARLQGQRLALSYWDRTVHLSWPDWRAYYHPDNQECSTFDTAMLLYYLSSADGSPPSGRWISFRELPDGSFYHQAFQGYSGDRLAKAFAWQPDDFTAAAQQMHAVPIPELGALAFAFRPLPRLKLAAVLWPGDEELAGSASILFDASAPRYLPTDGLALLGAGLTGRLLKLGREPRPS